MSFLAEIGGHPEYQKMLAQAKKIRPDLPQWRPQEDNTKDWQFKSGMQQGFDLALTIFTPR